MTLDWPPADEIDPNRSYAPYAEVYDVLFDHLNAETDFYVNQAKQIAGDGGDILELGSGTGRLTRHLLAAGFTVTAVDPSAEMLGRAVPRLAKFAPRYRPHQADIRKMELGQTFPIAMAPYGMVAHLLTDDDRLAAFSRVHRHLRPGGVFIFDDMPGWLGPAADSTQLYERSRGVDPVTGLTVRLLCNCLDVAEQPLSVRYDIIDWLSNGKVARRIVVRVVFRNIALADELALLRRAGFVEVELFGDFAGRPFDANNPGANQRLVVKCRRA
jgi:SAM-dependent methyltransferase